MVLGGTKGPDTVDIRPESGVVDSKRNEKRDEGQRTKSKEEKN